MSDFDGVIPTSRSCEVLCGCCVKTMGRLDEGTVDLTITSPPYFQQKNYGDDGQFGWEETRDEYLTKMAEFLRSLHRVTSTQGSAFVIIGDTYTRGSMQLIPQRLACISQDIGWNVRNSLIWAKTDPAPGRIKNRWRFTHEHILFLTKHSSQYYFNESAIRQPYSPRTLKRWGSGQQYGGRKSRLAEPSPGKKGRAQGNRFPDGKSFSLNPVGTLPPDVIRMPSGRSKYLHYATFPSELAQTFVMAASQEGELVFDPFTGSGTTGVAAIQCRRRFLGIEISAQYAAMAKLRLSEAMTRPDNLSP